MVRSMKSNLELNSMIKGFFFFFFLVEKRMNKLMTNMS